jgi:hypothetical protein
MPSFRDHLLTWLFFVAAAFVGAVDLVRGQGEVTAAMLMTGVVYIAGGWAAVSRSHRLARGATVVVAPFLAALPFYVKAPQQSDASVILAVAFLATLSSFAAAAITAMLVKPFNKPRAGRERQDHWQISLSEVMGWTVVVAIASVAMSKSFLPNELEWELIVVAATCGVPSGVMIALFLALQPHRDRRAVVLSAILFCAWFVISTIALNALLGARWFNGMSEIFLFVGIWILCVRLDEGALAAKAALAKEPALKIHDESVSDA